MFFKLNKCLNISLLIVSFSIASLFYGKDRLLGSWQSRTQNFSMLTCCAIFLKYCLVASVFRRIFTFRVAKPMQLFVSLLLRSLAFRLRSDLVLLLIS